MTNVGLTGAEVDEAREHVTDGSECWCGPEVEHHGVDSEGNEFELPDGRLINGEDLDFLTRLNAIYDFFELRDRMNARIHMAVADDIRWSPITIEVEALVADLTDRLCYIKDNEEESDGSE